MRYHYGRAVADFSDRSSLIVVIQFSKQIDDAVFPEARDRYPGFSVERDQLETWSRGQYSLIASTVGPVGHAPVDLSRRPVESLTFIGTIDPARLARHGIGGDDKPALIHCEVKNTVDHYRGRFAAGLRVWNEAV